MSASVVWCAILYEIQVLTNWIINQTLQALWSTGLRNSDPRLSELLANLQRIQLDLGREGPGNVENLKLNRDQFKA